MNKKYVKPQIMEAKIETSNILAGSCNHNKCFATDEGVNCECGMNNCHCHDHNAKIRQLFNDESFDE